MVIILCYLGLHTTFDDFECFGDVEAVVIGIIYSLQIHSLPLISTLCSLTCI